MTPDCIRPIANCVFRCGDCVLVGHAFDVKKHEYYCRPPGGGIEFGERSEDALRRELREEIVAEIDDVRLISVVENLFELEGEARHEIVFAFQAQRADPRFCETMKVPMSDDAWGGALSLEPFSRFESGDRKLYPDGLLELMRSNAFETSPRSV